MPDAGQIAGAGGSGLIGFLAGYLTSKGRMDRQEKRIDDIDKTCVRKAECNVCSGGHREMVQQLRADTTVRFDKLENMHRESQRELVSLLVEIKEHKAAR